MEIAAEQEKRYILSSTVLKAFRLIEYISRHQPVTTKEILDNLEFGRTQVHRLLTTLIHVGYVKRIGTTYLLTYKLFKLGSAVPLSRNLRDVAKPYMRELMKKTKENVYLNILVDDRIVAVDEVKSSHYVMVNPDLTYTFPLHVCASAKLLLGAYEPEERREFLESVDLTRETQNTIVDIDALLKLIDESLLSGYSLELGEYHKDLNSIAAPIYDYRNKIVATISISGPTIRLKKEVLLSIVPDIQSAARKISESLGQNF